MVWKRDAHLLKKRERDFLFFLCFCYFLVPGNECLNMLFVYFKSIICGILFVKIVLSEPLVRKMLVFLLF